MKLITKRRTTQLSLALITGLVSVSLQAQVPTRLSSGSGGGERHAVVSADGTTVAYLAMDQGARELFTVPTLGGAATRHTSAARVRVGWGTLDAWPSLSISGDGRYVTYWNAKGVHVVDTVQKTDSVVDPAYQHPYPRISSDGVWVVFQKPVAGHYEVFAVPASGGTPLQLTQKSGFGYRFPDLRGGSIVAFQKPVTGVQEVFALDTRSVAPPRQLSSSSGAGNRYARVAHDDASVVYEVTDAQNCRQAFVYELASNSRSAVTSNATSGDRNAVVSADGEVFLQTRGQGLELWRYEADGSKQGLLVQGLDGGLRRVSTDRHGRVVVFQAQDGTGTMEVYAARFCSQGVVSSFGQAGKPSVGTIVNVNSAYRCSLRYGLETSLGSMVGIFVFGLSSPDVAIPNAPGNRLYASPALLVPQVGQSGRYEVELAIPNGLSGQVFCQWLVLDARANAAGMVLSQGVRTTF